MTSNVDETFRRQSVVMDFLTGAISGDEARFNAAFTALNWVGAFREAFEKLVSVGAVHPSIRPVFRESWRRMKAESRARVESGVKVPVPDWHLERDLCDQPLLLADGLKLLLPSYEPRQCPLVLYRGQRLADHEAGNHGVWWSSCPVFAEFFGAMPSRTRRQTGVVLMTVDPHDAIIGEIDGEFLVDPRRLECVQIVSTLPSSQGYDLSDPDRCFYMKGIPDGFDGAGLIEWLDRGRPVEGLQAVRHARGPLISELMN
ncbi:MAG: hypothetical protein ACAH20_21380 [Methylobacteriaceae bacterium]